MRFLKIFLIIVSSFVLLGILYAVWEEFSMERPTTLPMIAKIIMVLMILLSIFNILYHIKSFRFYRRQEKRNLAKKIPKIFWIGTICFSIFLLYVAFSLLYNMLIYMDEFGYSKKDIFTIFTFMIPGLFGFLETSILKKRIKRLKEELDLKNEINSIGNIDN